MQKAQAATAIPLPNSDACSRAASPRPTHSHTISGNTRQVPSPECVHVHLYVPLLTEDLQVSDALSPVRISLAADWTCTAVCEMFVNHHPANRLGRGVFVPNISQCDVHALRLRKHQEPLSDSEKSRFIALLCESVQWANCSTNVLMLKGGRYVWSSRWTRSSQRVPRAPGWPQPPTRGLFPARRRPVPGDRTPQLRQDGSLTGLRLIHFRVVMGAN